MTGSTTDTFERIRVAASAQDVGSALQNRAFVSRCSAYRPGIEVVFFASRTTFELFHDTGLPTCLIDPSSTDVAARIDELLDAFDPTYFLVGLTVLGPTNVDEQIRRAALRRGVACGCIQDYWGYTGTFTGAELPETFFVLDEEAKKLTYSKTNGRATCIVTGSPKHEVESRQILEAIAQDDTETKPPRRRRRVLFCAQPHWIPGFIDNLELFAHEMNAIGDEVDCGFRLHPQDADQVSTFEARFKDLGVRWSFVSTKEQFERELVSADCIVTCFSTVGIDHSYLQAMSERPLGSLIYVTIGTPILAFMMDSIGSQDIPGARLGLGHQVKSVERLRLVLRRAVRSDDGKRRYWEAARRQLNVADSPSQKIFDHIVGRAGPAAARRG